jgi:predicted nucleic acid-binding protein
MLDSDILVDALRRYLPCELWLRSLNDTPTISGFVVMEIVNGCRNKADLQRALGLVSFFPVVWPIQADCVTSLSLLSTYRLSHSLGVIDSLVAATALGQGATLCTFNVKHFAAVPRLTTEQPYVRI